MRPISLDRGNADEPFRQALLRLGFGRRSISRIRAAIAFLTPAIFRAGIPLPATAPPSNYDVEIVLFTDTVILARAQTNFELVKTGEQQVGEIARDWAPRHR